MADTVKGRLTPKNRIALAGIELEGGWHKNPPNPVVHDGSVKFPSPRNKPQPLFSTEDEQRAWLTAERARLAQFQFKAVGEIVSPPLKAEAETVEAFIKENYPSAVNDTCGLHVHMSFTHKRNYNRLMTPEFTKAMVDGLRKWAAEEGLKKDHPLMARIMNPDHPHCAHTYCGEEQVKATSKDFHSRGKPNSRYTAINYCFNQHQTVECRLLCMMDTPEQACRAVLEVLAITNRFLAKVRTRELKQAIAIPKGQHSVSRYRVTV